MSDKEQKDFEKKITLGLELAEKRMLIEKAIRNEEVIMSKDNVIYSEKAMTLLERYYPSIAKVLQSQGYSQNLYLM